MERSNKIDFLRFVGLAMIIFAHVGPPAILFQLRNFDVPLMVLVAGMSFGLAFKGEPYLKYLWKRVKRLLLPVWVFLTVYFISIYLFWPSVEELSLDTILNSYLLISGIGYVWIIRVFLLVAIVSPFIYIFSKNTKSHNSYLVILLSVFIIYELIRYASMPYLSDGYGKYLSMIFLYIIPYSLLFALGLRIPQFTTKTNFSLFAIFTLLFITIAVYFWVTVNGFVQTQNYKYPPSIYYFSYAVAVSIFLWLIGDKIWKLISYSKTICNIILFIARNSIWIYLWHIPLIKSINTNFILKYIIVFIIATCIVYIQVLLVEKYLIPKISNQNIKKNLKLILTG